MTIFFILAALMVVLCLLYLLSGLFRNNQQDTDQEATNITLAREKLAMLDAALSDGALDHDSYRYERQQLELDLAADLDTDTAPGTRNRGQMVAAVVISIFIPVAAGALYLQIGNPAAITGSSVQTAAGEDSSTESEAPSLAEMLPRLEERLAESPDDIDGWRLLGRSYLAINDFGGAQQAFQKALALDENDVDTLAQLAESTAMTRDGMLAGEPMAYLERAVSLNPGHEHTLWLIAIARQQAGAHQQALADFNRLAAMAAGNDEALATIEQMRSRSVQALALDSQGASASEDESRLDNPASDNTDIAASTSRSQSGQTKTQTESEPQTIDSVSLIVSVDLDPAITPKIDTAATLFIYARASEGPPMPLAVSRHIADELPLTVVLDDSMAMIPAMKLSAFPEVTVGARISASGNAIAQPGDWYHEVDSVNVLESPEVSLRINQQVR